MGIFGGLLDCDAPVFEKPLWRKYYACHVAVGVLADVRSG